MPVPSILDPTMPDEKTGRPQFAAISQGDRDVMRMVQRAIEAKQLLLAFQPVVAAAFPKAPAFQEGLIRVLDHTGRIIPAADFIGVIEDRDLGRQIDTFALELGLVALAEEPSLRLSISMSARSIGDPGWGQTLHRGLEADPTAAGRLILQITGRSAIVMPDRVQAFITDLQGSGLSFALDDFGAGYIAFRHLGDFHLDILKIDSALTRKIASRPGNRVIAQALLSVARKFDKITMAEEVETLEDAETLIDAGCDLLQGNFFGAPTVHPWWRQQVRWRVA